MSYEPEALLRAALGEVPGFAQLPAGSYPTLPLLHAAYGQQHLVTTFALGAPAPAALPPTGPGAPAVTLHVLLPEGYHYWQPESGTSHYLAGVPTLGQLPADYRAIVLERTRQLAAQPQAPYPAAPCRAYLQLLGQVARAGWLLAAPPEPAREKALARRLRAALQQLAEPALTGFYQGRGPALHAWLAQAAYEQCWAEQAVAQALAAVPPWLADAPSGAGARAMSAPVPAVLDGRQCIVLAFAWRPAAAGRPRQRGAVVCGLCCVSYPEQEIVWHQPALAASAGPPASEASPPEPPEEAPPEVVRAYQQCVSQLLENRWLVTRYPPTPAETGAAEAMRAHLAWLLASPFAEYYRQQAWQLLGWVRRLTAAALPGEPAQQRL